jgi:CRISPR-associated Csx2 family protein
MSVTLLSFLGGNRGKNKNQPTYSEANYCSNKKNYKTALFAEALLNIGQLSISQVVIFGTKTSIWEYLIPEQENEDLYLNIISEIDSEEGITKNTLSQCEQVISELWEMPVSLYAGETGVTNVNAGIEMINYVNMLSYIKNNNNILLDVTHGFRTMPVLLMSALQYQYALTGNKQFKDYQLTYGEYNTEGNSPVHFLDSLTDNFAIANACQLFFDKFESEELVNFLTHCWEPGAKAIKNLSVTIQGNYLSQLDERLRQLKNALDKKPQCNIPPWFDRVYDEIEKLYQRINAENPYEAILNISDLLIEKHFNAQAVLGILLGYEIYICHYFQEQESIDDYKQTDSLKKKFRELLKDNYYKNKEIINQLDALNETRNMIAHSGGKRKNGGKPNADNLSAQYARYRKMLIDLFSTYKPCK